MSEILEQEFSDTDLGGWVLDEMDDKISRYLVMTEEQRTALILFGAATHIIDVCATFPRLLYASELEESAKTLAMKITAALSHRPVNAAGTGFGLDARLIQAAQEPEKRSLTVYKDEVSSAFGRDGFGGNSKDPFVMVLREGYKKGATATRSRRGVPEEYPIFVPVIMTGLQTAVPRDIRTRCIVITMQQGIPEQYYDVRDAEPSMKASGEALGYYVRQVLDEIADFRIRDLGIPKMTGRKAEVWEPLFAVASCLGGPRWVKRAIASFRALALSEKDRPVLTERQKILQAIAELAPGLTLDGFVPGLALADELRRLDDPLFQGRTEIGAAKLISNAMPVDTRQRLLSSGDRVRGYYLQDVLAAWEAVKPAELDEAEPPEEENPFEVTNEEEDDEQPDPGARVARVNSTQPLPQAPAQPPLTPAQALAKAAQATTPPPGQRDGQRGKGGGS